MTEGVVPRPSPTVVLVGAEGTLPGVGERLRRHGVILHRVIVLRAVPLPLARRHGAARRMAGIDTLIVTSRETVSAFLSDPLVRGRLGSVPRLDVLAVGPGTGKALRRIGLVPSWTTVEGGGAAIGAHLAHGRRRRVLYPRSTRAGPGLARALRRLGHTVLDPPVYRLERPRPVAPRDRRRLLNADLVVATSPSALSHLRAGLPRESFRRLCSKPGLIVLGERSARSARGHGFRAVQVSPTTAEQGFTRFLLRELRRGP